MKLIIFSSCLLLLCQCTQGSYEKTARTEISCDTLHAVSDSLEMREFWYHMQARKSQMSTYILPDTAYRFWMYGGWGEFDLLCSIYATGGSYQAQTVQMNNPFSNDNISYREITRPIDPAQWQAIRDHFDRSGFWCANPKFDHICFDATTYKVWAKEGERNRMIQWDFCQNMNDTIRQLALHIQSVCGYPEYEFSEAQYARKGDTLLFRIVEEMDQQIFMKSSYFEVGGKEVYVDPSSGLLKLTGKEDSLLHSIYFVRNRIDGSVQKKLIRNFQKVHLKTLLR